MTPIRLLLNSPFTGANAFFAVAEDVGIFRRAGLEVAFTEGRGAYTAASRLADEGFDAAYGDVNALIEMAASGRQDHPVAVLMVMQRTPSTITVLAEGPIAAPQDLEETIAIGHASDVALRTFPAFAMQTGLDPRAVRIEAADRPMADFLLDLQEGRVDAVFGYVSTHGAAAASVGLPLERLRFLRYRDHVPDLYGSALMVSHGFLRTQREAIAALVHAVRLALERVLEDPERALDGVQRRNPDAGRDIEKARMLTTLAEDVGSQNRILDDFGGCEPERLARSIHLLAEANVWPRKPSAHEIFSSLTTAR